MDSNGRVALVTGASRGIGKALAIGLARNGYDVAVADLPVETSALNEARREVESLGRRAYSFELDVRRKNEADQTVAKLLQRAGQIDVLVNNAGILKTSLLQDLDEDAWNAHFDVNAKGVLFMCQAVLPHMRQRKTGRIINIASIAGRQGVATQGHYAATKAAVITLTRVLAQEVGMDGVTVNAICPGIIMTEMGRNNLRTAEARLYWENATSLRRLGQPEDIVGPVCFFASADSDFVTGQSLNVCGGLYFH
ncbi:MAG: SDR family NAD(P)-dependent oxidoreductase [Roseiarcus sp.]